MWVLFLTALIVGLSESTCPPTSEEQTIASIVSTRKSRVSSGEIWKQIHAGTYSYADLEVDLIQLWVNIPLLQQGVAIDNFQSIMQRAQEVFNANRDSVSLSWIEQILGYLTGDAFKVFFEIRDCIQPVVSFFQSLHAKANTPASNFYVAATNFRRALPATSLQRYQVVDDFINKLRNNNNKTRLLQGYQFATGLIATMPSYRNTFNQYMGTFMGGIISNSKPGTFNIGFYSSADSNLDNKWKFQFPAIPNGLDACTVVNRILAENSGCLPLSHFNAINNTQIMLIWNNALYTANWICPNVGPVPAYGYHPKGLPAGYPNALMQSFCVQFSSNSGMQILVKNINQRDSSGCSLR